MLAAGVAHEIRNPLTAIKARLFTLQKRLTTGTPNFTDSEVIAQEINRLEAIVKDVLLFARPNDPQLVTINAEEPLREVEALLKPELEKSRIDLTVEGADGGRINIDPQQIKQVLINLVQNAAESIGENGTIRLRARRELKRLAAGKVEAVILEVIDNGKGIPAEVQERFVRSVLLDQGNRHGSGLADRVAHRGETRRRVAVSDRGESRHDLRHRAAARVSDGKWTENFY